MDYVRLKKHFKDNFPHGQVIVFIYVFLEDPTWLPRWSQSNGHTYGPGEPNGSQNKTKNQNLRKGHIERKEGDSKMG